MNGFVNVGWTSDVANAKSTNAYIFVTLFVGRIIMKQVVAHSNTNEE